MRATPDPLPFHLAFFTTQPLHRFTAIAGIGSTDHLSFTAQGVPGFTPIQEYADYDVRIHHTNIDTQDGIKPDDVKQGSVIFATLAYHAAMRDAAIPRRETPRTTP